MIIAREFIDKMKKYAAKGFTFETDILNWEDMYRFARDKRLIYFLHNYIGKDSKDKKIIENRMILNVIKVNQKRVIKEIFGCLTNKGIPCVIIKGLAQEHMLFNNFRYRDLGDIDIVVQPENVAEAYAELYESGFRQIGNDTNQLVREMSPFYWEYTLLGKDGKTCVELKTGSSSFRKDATFFFNNSEKYDMDGVDIKTLSPVGTLIHILANMHATNIGRDSYKGGILRDDFDTYLAINKFGFPKIMLDIAGQYEVKHVIYEALDRIDKIFGLSDEQRDYMELFHLSHCNYPREIEGWSCKNQYYNAASLFCGHLPDCTLEQLLDKDRQMSLFRQRMKTALYSSESGIRHLDSSGGSARYVYPFCEGVSVLFAFLDSTGTLKIDICVHETIFAKDDSDELFFTWYEYDTSIPNLHNIISFPLAQSSGPIAVDIAPESQYDAEPYISACVQRQNAYRQAGLSGAVSIDGDIRRFELILMLGNVFFTSNRRDMICELSIQRYHKYGLKGSYNLGQEYLRIGLPPINCGPETAMTTGV